MLQAPLSRRKAIAQDLQRERNRQEKANKTNTPERIRQSLASSIEFLVKQLAELQQDIEQHIERHPDLKDDMALFQSIPAVGPQVGGNLLSVMHAMTSNQPSNWRRIWGWCRWNGSRAVWCWGMPGFPRPGLHASVLCCVHGRCGGDEP